MTRSMLLMIALGLAGCTESGTLIPDDDDAIGDDDDATADPNDLDGDGDPAATDCDDADPDAFNGNTEVCGDPADNDCDAATVCYAAQIGGASQTMAPITGESGVAAWYESVAIADNGLTRSDSAVVLLYRRDAQGPVSLVFTLDDWDDGSGGYALMSLQGLGSAALLLVDDPGEGDVSGGNGSFGFQWVDCCVDGAAIGPLDAGFCVDIEIPESEGLGGGWLVQDGPDQVSMGSVDQVLRLCETQ